MFRGINRQAWWIPQIESLGGILGLTAFFLYFYGKSSLLYPSFHPFLVIVLLMAGRYGFVAGFSSAIMAILDYYLILLWQDRWDTLLPGDFSFLWPSAFLFSGMVVGEMRDGEARKLRDLNDRYVVERNTATTATLQLDILIKAKKELEKRIFLEPNTVSDLYDVFRSLEKDEIDSISSTLLSLCISFIGADSVGLYRRDREGFLLDSSTGLYEVPKEVPLSYLPFRQSADSGEAVSLRSHGIFPELPREGKSGIRPIGIYPIRTQEGRVRFLLVVWHAPFERLTPEFFQMMGMMADRASARLEFLETHERTRESVSVDETTGFLRPVFFARRAAEEVSKAFRYRSSFTLMDIAFRPGEDGAVDSRSVYGAMREVAKRLLRDVDLVGLVDRHTEICFCLPHTSEEGARVVEEKLLSFWHLMLPSFPLLAGISLDVHRVSYVPVEGREEADRLLYRSILKRLDGIFFRDPATGFWGGGGFFREVERECGLAKEKKQTLAIVRVDFTAPSWEDAVFFGKSLANRKSLEGRLLLPESAILGVPLEGNALWVLLPLAPQERVEQIVGEVHEIWEELDIPRLKKGRFSTMGQSLRPDEKSLLMTDEPLAQALWALSPDGFRDAAFDSRDDAGHVSVDHGFFLDGLGTAPGFSQEMSPKVSAKDSRPVSPEPDQNLSVKVEHRILEAGPQGMTRRDLVKYSRGFAKLSEEGRSRLLDELVESGVLHCEQIHTKGRLRVGYIHASYVVNVPEQVHPLEPKER